MLENLMLLLDTVSRSQRALVAECERQQNRLYQLLHWYDHQRKKSSIQLRRQSERLNKEVREQINTRSKVVIRERTRLRHLLDNDDTIDVFTPATSKSLYHIKDPIDDRKRQVYGCLLPQFKAPVTKSLDSWPQYKSHSMLSQSDSKKHLEKQRCPMKKFIQSPAEQRTRMNTIINKCLYQFGECDCNGYDHFLHTCDPKQNAQILAQQIRNDKNKYR